MFVMGWTPSSVNFWNFDTMWCSMRICNIVKKANSFVNQVKDKARHGYFYMNGAPFINTADVSPMKTQRLHYNNTKLYVRFPCGRFAEPLLDAFRRFHQLRHTSKSIPCFYLCISVYLIQLKWETILPTFKKREP